MKLIRKISLLACCSLLMTACLKDSNLTVMLPTGTVSNNVIPDEIRDLLTDHITIYEGNDLPDIEGYFLVDELQSLYCSDEGHGGFEPGHRFADEYIYFGPVSSAGLIYDYEEKQANTHATSDLVQVMGEGNNFTAYFVAEGYADMDGDGEEETWSKASTVMSGTISSEGIHNWRMAFIMVDKKDPLSKLMAVNEYRVFTEADNLASRIEKWNAPAVKKAGDKDASDDDLPSVISLFLK